MKWISVKDRLPEPFEDVLVYWDKSMPMEVCNYDPDGWWCEAATAGEPLDSEPTHWMPLPEAPHE